MRIFKKYNRSLLLFPHEQKWAAKSSSSKNKAKDVKFYSRDSKKSNQSKTPVKWSLNSLWSIIKILLLIWHSKRYSTGLAFMRMYRDTLR
jgi:hypothetical protein